MPEYEYEYEYEYEIGRRSYSILDRAAVRRLLDEQDRGGDHGERLWNLLVLELWLREQG